MDGDWIDEVRVDDESDTHVSLPYWSPPPVRPPDDPEIAALLSLPYRDYLHTDHWQEVRKAALRRAGHRCQWCHCRKRLWVHHRTYARKGQEWPDDLIALCEKCHDMFHREVIS